MVDYLCDIGAFSKTIFTDGNIRFNISDPPLVFSFYKPGAKKKERKKKKKDVFGT